MAILVALSSSGCATYLASSCVSRGGGSCQGTEAILAASLLVIETATSNPDPGLTPLGQDPPYAPGTRPPSK